MKKRKKVLLLIKSIDGGTGTFLGQLLKLQTDFDFSILALEKPRFRKRYTGYPLYYIPPYLHAFFALEYPIFIQFMCEFFYFLFCCKKTSPDIIFSIDTHSNMLASTTKLFSHTPPKVVLTNHNNISAVFQAKLSPFQSMLVRYFGTFLFNKADAIISVSKGTADNMKKQFVLKKNPQVIFYGIDVSLAKKLGRQSLKNDKKFFQNSYTILSIGRFEMQKDFFTLIQAFALCKKRIHDASLVLIGDGTQKKQLEKLTNDLGITHAVHFLGWKQNIFPYLHHASVFVLSSFYEGFGYVLLEAFSQNIPVIATKSPFGPAAVLDNGTYGRLVAVQNSEKMSDALLFFSDPKNRLYYSRKSAERSHMFTEKSMLEKYKKILKTL